ncbi:DUF6893 family small protein [Streptomyces sp. NPDC059862]
MNKSLIGRTTAAATATALAAFVVHVLPGIRRYLHIRRM